MDVPCINCHHPNPAEASFCSRCGMNLAAVRGRSRPTALANVALLVGAAVSLAAASTALEPLRYTWQRLPEDAGLFLDYAAGAGSNDYGRTLEPAIDRDYDLCEHKAQAMFNLLAPKDIAVIVSRRGGGVHVQGTPWEIRALDRFVELITRKNHQDRDGVRRYVKSLLRTSETTKEYRLPPEKREVLGSILALDDVPLLVISNSQDRLTVTATAPDQSTVSDVVQILRGKKEWAPCSGVMRWLGLPWLGCSPEVSDTSR
ncbi:MAG: zinc ribbon domain-containing protein [Phycisphaerae bacterium]